ncbi:amino acid adenylation domain-containing protein [Ruminiclostridium sufflavum DSM 19573]|uniref:Amino acid adenylation domain-containing protein n=1 Tax=Ruminiclostridium sufflavum DSM 19573 TaxID=1121337 RepID=A0A318XMT7_9FIRM|nr:non-ribosomal peptide synthetase/type I polyketide synthase [Ruminiclostridium sufflavum]PYG89177.1 amino acid adenylation domain-containing protein [Ruminiclostridium sufflavum DSM 19573]
MTDKDMIKKSLLEIQRLKKLLYKKENVSYGDIAIIGMACKFPGGIDNISDFWEVISDNRCIIDFPDSRRFESYDCKNKYTEKGGYLKNNVESFDSLLFKISPDEAGCMDPQQKLFLKVCYEALENSGYSATSMKGSNTGIYTGVSLMDYANTLKAYREKNGSSNPKDITGTGFSFLSGRTSYYFGFHGASITIDTACSSSLVAVHEACSGIRNGDCDMALAGGVNIIYSPETTELLSQLNILSPDCTISTFDNRANGTVRGEGCGIVVLKKLDKAQEDGDNILAVIKGSNINQDGASSGLTSPYGPMQESLMKRAWERSGIAEREVDYIEAHGTGTKLGDAIEITSLGNIVSREREEPLYIGTVKTNIGHLEAAAGVAGLIKTVLMINNGTIPAVANFKEPSQNIQWKNYNIKVPYKNIKWERADKKRVAGVSAFGLSGTNAHVVLEEYKEDRPVIQEKAFEEYSVKLSSPTVNGLKKQAKAYKNLFKKFYMSKDISLENIEYSINISKSDYREKAIVNGKNYEELIKSFDMLLDNKIDSCIKYGNESKKIVFMFTGQGSQQAGMFKKLYTENKVFAKYFDECNLYYMLQTSHDLKDIIFQESDFLENTYFTQPALFSVEYSFAKMLMSFGVTPDIMLGHSVGEYVAGCLAGVFSLRDSIKLITERGRLMSNVSGKMAAVFSDREFVRKKIERGYEKLSIAASNSRNQTVITGSSGEIEEFCEEMKAMDIKTSELKVRHPFHSPLMNDAAEEYRKLLGTIKFNMPVIEILSNVTGEKEGAKYTEIGYWISHMLSEVHFYDELMSLKDENAVFVEIGPKGVLTAIAKEIVSAGSKCLFENFSGGKYPNNLLKQLLSELFVNGCEINWRSYYQSLNIKFLLVRVPNYAFDEKVLSIGGMKEQQLTEKSSVLSDYTEKENTVLSSFAETKEFLIKEIVSALGIQEGDFTDKDNLLLYGMDSIVIMKLASSWKDKLNITLTAVELIKNPTLKGWAELLWSAGNAEGEKDGAGAEDIKFVPDKSGQYEKFSLNEVQYAYCIGRNDTVEWGGAGCYAYFEVDLKELDNEKFKGSLQKLVERHPMLRAVISQDGIQKIEQSISLPYTVYNFTEMQGTELHLERIRKEMSSQVLPLGKPMFDIRVTMRSDNLYRIHFGIDFLIADAMSLQIFWNDLYKLYLGEKLPEIEVTYKEYLEYREQKKKTRHYEGCREYWLSRAENFPGRPRLPVRNISDNSSKGKFSRKQHVIDYTAWGKFVRNAAKFKLTPSAAMLGLYSEVLSAWGGEKRFGVMLTVFERENVHPQINDVVGDFTKLMLVDAEREHVPVKDNAFRLQAKMQECMQYNDYSAVDFVREINKKQGDAIYPIVFTSAIGINSWENSSNCFYENLGFSMSSTPQVWLDFQLFSQHRGIVISWDANESVFCDNVVNDMFDRYCELVLMASEAEAFWETCLEDMRPHKQAEVHARVNDTYKENCGSMLLFENIEENAVKYPHKTAVVFEGREYSYSRLAYEARRISALLIENGVGQNTFVAVQMKKSFEQIAAVIGITRLGAAYVPVLYNQPIERTEAVLRKSGANIIFTDESLKNGFGKEISVITAEMKSDKTDECSHQVSPESLAYVIFTSGSTGTPKGVCINHFEAMNTIYDVNRKYAVDSQSVILGLSSLSFDLSVYDVFGVLSAGGTLVLPGEDDKTNPGAWFEMSEQMHLTLWNSVPALLELYLDWLIRHKKKDCSIRRVILSGDWIPLHILEKVNRVMPAAKLTSMGGATEASIWSNYFDVEKIERDWVSVPYGYPLANQGYYILDEFGRPCPDWVEGRLHIYGSGVAEGYLKERELTENAFTINSLSGKRMYNTGDFGRYMNNGIIEFLGRKDAQVKINGFRVELGEIENQIISTGLVSDSVAAFYKKSENEKYLLAYYTPIEIASEHTEDLSRVAKKAKEASGQLPQNISPQEFRKISDSMESMSLGIMINTFLNMKVLTSENPVLSVNELVSKGLAAEKYKKLLTQWADSLVKHGYIEKTGMNYRPKTKLEFVDIDAILKETNSYEHVSYWADSLEFLVLCNKSILEILRADVNPLAILFQEGTTSRAENFYRYNPVASYNNNIVAQAIAEYVSQYDSDHTVRVLEFGAGTGGTTAEILSRIAGRNLKYTYTDLSTFFTTKARNMFKEYDFVDYGLYNIDNYPVTQGYDYGKYDIIIGANVLHDAKILNTTLQYLRSLLTNQGMLVILELTTNKLFYKVSIGLIEGFSGYEDERVAVNEPLLSVEQWREKLLENKFSSIYSYPEKGSPAGNFEQNVILCCAGNNLRYESQDLIKEKIRHKLPSYMLPYKIYPISSIPLNSNAKVNRSLLPIPDFNNLDIELVSPENPTEEALCNIFAEVLEIDRIGTNQDLFQIGGDSLKAIQIVSKLQEQGFNATLADIYGNPEIKRLSSFLINNSENKSLGDISRYSAEPVRTREKYDLNSIQQAYLMGRSKDFDLGNISCHYYVEIETKLDIARLQESLNKVVKHQPALRSVVYSNGYQQVLDEVPEYIIEVTDISDLSDFQKQMRIMKYRNEVSHDIFELGKWPMFRFKAIKTGEGIYLLVADIDVMIADAASFYIMGKELTYYYNNKMKLPEFKFEFSDYLRSLNNYKKTGLYEQDRQYWQGRLKDFPDSVQLPVKNSVKNIKSPRFKRLSKIFGKKHWERLKKVSAQYGITPAATICCAYCKVLAYFCNKERFAVNVTIFNRYNFYEDIENIMGDFTSTMLLDANMKAGLDFWGQAAEMQKVFAEGMDHRNYDGIDFMKDLSLNREARSQTIVPVIFTCAIFDKDVKGWKEIGDLKYAVSQTSQVLLDNQITVLDGELTVAWDYVENVLDSEVINDMYSSYISLLDDICCGVEIIKPFCEAAEKLYKHTDDIQELLSLEKLLLARFDSQSVAVVDNGKRYTYEQLNKESNRVACKLIKMGCTGKKAGISSSDGYISIAGILGILKAGNTCVLGESTGMEDLFLGKEELLPALRDTSLSVQDFDVRPSEELFVIGKSAVTKGYLTGIINEINNDLNVSEEDKILLVKGDNSFRTVYAIFGAVARKSVIQIADEINFDLIKNLEVSVLNMTCEEAEKIDSKGKLNNVRHILISGRTVAAGLLERLREMCVNSGMTVMTESDSSLWLLKNHVTVIRERKIIQGGYVMAGIKSQVLNYEREICPVNVKGGLFYEKYDTGRKQYTLLDSGMEAVMRKDGYIEIFEE